MNEPDDTLVPIERIVAVLHRYDRPMMQAVLARPLTQILGDGSIGRADLPRPALGQEVTPSPTTRRAKGGLWTAPSWTPPWQPLTPRRRPHRG
jgi:hypothetical protein